MAINFNGVRVRPSVVAPVSEPKPPTTELIGWWRADDINQAEGSSVNSWIDRSGNTGSLIVVPSKSAPVLNLTVAGFGNKPGVNFQGNAQLYRVYPANYPVGAGAFSMYVVHNPVFSGVVNTMFGWGQNYSSRQRVCFSLFNSTPWFIAADAYAAGSNSYEATAAPQISSIYSANNADMKDAEVWVDGAVPANLVGVGSATTWNIADPVPEVRMGGLSQENSISYTGTIAEVLVYRKNQDSSERAATLAYLSGRYGISVA